MANNIQRIAAKMGATIITEVPDTGGGTFGAARLVAIIGALQKAQTQNQNTFLKHD